MTAPALSQKGLPFVAGVLTPSRYRTCIQLVRLDGKVVYTPRRRIQNDIRADDLYHVWADGEWLDQLAYTYYGDPTLWYLIADFNLITEYRVVQVGIVLRMPSKTRLLLEILPALS